MTEKPRPPAELGRDGRALWRDTLRQFELSAPELALLRQLCQTVDELAAFKSALAEDGPYITGAAGQRKVNPMVAALVNHRKMADQLVVALALPVEGESVGRRRSAAAKQSADARWRKPRGSARVASVQYGRAAE